MTEHETIEHLFFSCSVTMMLWEDVYRWLDIGINNSLFNKSQVMIYMEGLSKKISKMVIIFIPGKYHIHKNKWNNSKPTINCFKNEIENYITSLKVLSEENQSVWNNVRVSCFFTLQSCVLKHAEAFCCNVNPCNYYFILFYFTCWICYKLVLF